MVNTITRTLYMLAVAILGALLISPHRDITKDSLVWPFLWFTLAGLVFFTLVVIDLSGQRLGREPSKIFASYQVALLSPVGLPLLALGLFSFGIGTVWPALFDTEPDSPSVFWHFSYGIGALLGWFLGQRVLHRKGRNDA